MRSKAELHSEAAESTVRWRLPPIAPLLISIHRTGPFRY